MEKVTLMKKKKKSYWYLYRYTGDMAVYCSCMNCGWSTSVSTVEDIDTLKVVIGHIPKYCQECGKKNRLYNGCVVYLYDGKTYKLIPNGEKVYPINK